MNLNKEAKKIVFTTSLIEFNKRRKIYKAYF